MSTITGTCRNHGVCLLENMPRALVYVKWKAHYSKDVVSRYEPRHEKTNVLVSDLIRLIL